MAAVVWRVEVHAIPACGEADCCSDATGTELVGETGRVVGANARRSLVVVEGVFYEASVANIPRFSFLAAEHGVTG